MMMRRPLSRFLVGLTGGTVLALVAGVCAATASPAAMRPAAAAHSGWGSAVRLPGIGLLNKGGSADASSIACTSAGNCVTGGFYLDAKEDDQVFLAVEKAGHWGRAFEIPGTATLNSGNDAQFDGISCPAAGDCVAAGTYFTSSHALEAFVVSERSGHWAQATEIRGFGALNVDGYGESQAISCAAVGYCTVGGWYADSSDTEQPFLATESKGHWAKAVKVPGIAALNAGGHAALTSISCRQRGYCTAGGYTERTSAITTAFVLSEKKGHWSNAQRLPGMSDLNHGNSAYVDALSCASAGNCVVGGSYRPSLSSTHSQAYLAMQKNGSWQNAKEVPGTASLNKGGNGQLNVAFCPAAGACVAGGYYTDKAGHGQLFLISQHKGSWRTAETLPGLLTVNKGSTSEVYSLSCSSAGNCSAGGYFENSSFRELAFVITESGGHWARLQRVPGIAGLTSGDSQVAAVSCTSAGHCSAAGSAGTAFVLSRT
jgi:hypothetical protein